MSNWISVNERMPNDDDRKYLITRKKLVMYTTDKYYTTIDIWRGNKFPSDVIAWMELPEPYVEK